MFALLDLIARAGVTLLTESAGRWLRITYQSIAVNQNQFTNLG